MSSITIYKVQSCRSHFIILFCADDNSSGLGLFYVTLSDLVPRETIEIDSVFQL